MVIFHSYVKLPEGNSVELGWTHGLWHKVRHDYSWANQETLERPHLVV